MMPSAAEVMEVSVSSGGWLISACSSSLRADVMPRSSNSASKISRFEEKW